MSKRGLRQMRAVAAGILLFITTGWSKDAPVACGSYDTRAQEEAFLHQRSLARRATQRSSVQAQRAARANVDIGNIAIIGAGNGVVSTRNPFDLVNRTITFAPEGSGFSTASTMGSYDTTAAMAGVALDLDDDDFHAVELPFPFPFFGSSYSKVFVNSNGTLTFGAGDLDYSGEFGHFAAGPPSIAGLFADLNPPGSQTGVRSFLAEDHAVFSWVAVPVVGDGFFNPGQTFQIRIESSGSIKLTYSADSGSISRTVVGVAPGGAKPVELVDLSETAGSYPGGVGESFTSSFTSEVDVVAAAQRFYQTHDDAYDYLVFYNAMGVPAGSGIVAYELTTRSTGDGYGDIPIDEGALYGSPRRLQAVLNLGPTSQYPVNPLGTVTSRGSIGDTPLSILAHEAGHLFLALVSVPSPVSGTFPPMLGAGLAHWAFPFHSDASFLEGNRIEDRGAGASPRYLTTGTVERYSPLDQYLMGFRAPAEVAPTFAVLNSGFNNTRAPQTGLTFNGSRLDITVDDVIAAAGRRTPDSTVAQRSFRMAFVMIVEEDADLSPNSPAGQAVVQVEGYRAQFEQFFAKSTDFRATVSTTLGKGVDWSLAPNGGLVLDSTVATTVKLSEPAPHDVIFTVEAPGGIVTALNAPLQIGQGNDRAQLVLRGSQVGVAEVRLIPDDPAYETVVARVPVRPRSELRVRVVSGDFQDAVAGPLAEPLVIEAVDENKVPYGRQPVEVAVEGGGTVSPMSGLTDEYGRLSLNWTTTDSSFNRLTFQIPGGDGSGAATALGPPGASEGGVVNSASYRPGLAPGGFGSIFGGSLAAGDVIASARTNFPNFLGTVTVTVNGRLAQLSYISDGLINFIVPAQTAVGTAEIRVETALGVSGPIRAEIAAHAPGVFFNTSTGVGAVLISGLWVTTEQHPAKPGEFLAVYATGLGANPQAAVTIGGLPVEVTYAGTTVIPGLEQVNVKIPAGLPHGRQELLLTVNGITANSVAVIVE